jgi:ParB family chromosome partitioning protein
MADKIVDIAIGRIGADEHKQRLDMDETAINDLTSSISRIGLVSPLIVVSAGDDYVIVAGHRRFKACQLAGLKTVPCIVRKMDDGQLKELAFAENFFRANLSPVEQAAAIKDVIDSGSMTVEQIASGFHRSCHWVERQVDILDWPADVLNAVHIGKISISSASNLSVIHDDTYRHFLVNNAVENGATARTTAAWLQAWRAMAPPEEAIQQEPVAGPSPSPPATPQAPCMVCRNVFRTDELSHIPVCVTCIKAIRDAESQL